MRRANSFTAARQGLRSAPPHLPAVLTGATGFLSVLSVLAPSLTCGETTLPLPDPKDVERADPSEAVHSSQIEGIVRATYALGDNPLQAIAVTEEPEGGVPQPTGAIVVAAAAGS